MILLGFQGFNEFQPTIHRRHWFKKPSVYRGELAWRAAARGMPSSQFELEAVFLCGKSHECFMVSPGADSLVPSRCICIIYTHYVYIYIHIYILYIYNANIIYVYVYIYIFVQSCSAILGDLGSTVPLVWFYHFCHRWRL